jgi:hypothetical protein
MFSGNPWCIPNFHSGGSTAPSYCHRAGIGEKRFFEILGFQSIFEGLSKLLSTNRKMLYAPVLTS